MLIQNTQPVVTPQVEAKSYPHLWISRVVIMTPNTNEGRVDIELCPYNSDTKEILSSRPKRITIDNIWSAASQNPAIQNAMNSLLEAVNEIQNPQPQEPQPDQIEEAQ